MLLLSDRTNLLILQMGLNTRPTALVLARLDFDVDRASEANRAQILLFYLLGRLRQHYLLHLANHLF